MLGGQILAAAKAPKREDYAKIADWLGRQVEKAGVDVTPRRAGDGGRRARPPSRTRWSSRPGRPRASRTSRAWTSRTSPRRSTALLGRVTPGRRVVVVDEDGHYAAPTTADLLAGRGCQVTLISKYFMVGEDIDEGIRSDLYSRLFAQGVVLQPLTAAKAIVPGGLRTRHTFSGAEATIEADTVVLSFGGKANDSLFHELDGRVPELRLVGDAVSPRRIHDAMLDGTRAARAL